MLQSHPTQPTHPVNSVLNALRVTTIAQKMIMLSVKGLERNVNAQDVTGVFL